MGRLCRPRAGGRGMCLMPLCFNDLLVTHCMVTSLHLWTRRKRVLVGWKDSLDMFMRFWGRMYESTPGCSMRTLEAGRQLT